VKRLKPEVSHIPKENLKGLTSIIRDGRDRTQAFPPRVNLS
jgi:hypothetical protein